MRVTSAAAAVCLCLVGIVAAQEAEAVARKHTNIPAQGLGPALQILAHERGFQVVYLSDQVESLQTTGAVGEFTDAEALVKLLQGTGLMPKFVDEKTITLTAPITIRTNSLLPATGDGARRAGEGTAHATAADSPLASEPLRVSQVDQDKKTTDQLSDKNDDSPKEGLEEIVVTGSHIRGAASAGSNVMIIDREMINKSGYGTVQDFLKTLPQNFGGGVSEDTFSDFRARNVAYGTAVNLRGLGADATLTLVNGRRQASSGLSGGFVDISSIALSAIERVEILPDGASAIYGTDAVGGVVNFILRKDFAGAETQARFSSAGGDADEVQVSQLFGHNWARGNALIGYQYHERDPLLRGDRPYTASYDLRPFGGSDFRSYISSPGNILNPLTGAPAFAIPAGQDGTSLSVDDLLTAAVNYDDSPRGNNWLPSHKAHTAFASLRQDIATNMEAFAEVRFGTRRIENRIAGQGTFLAVPSTNPFYVNPFEDVSPGIVYVAYNFNNDLGPFTEQAKAETFTAAAGVSADLASAWRVNLTASYGGETTTGSALNDLNYGALTAALADPDPQTALNPFGSGGNNNPQTLATLRVAADAYNKDAYSRTRNTNLSAEGPLLSLPGGNLRLAVGADYRMDDLAVTETGATTRNRFDRNVGAAYAEVAVPIVGAPNDRAGIRGLNLTLAGRYENYSDFGSTTNPKIGISWLPTDALKFRGTWGTSFKAPRLPDLAEVPGSSSRAITTYPDPLSNGVYPGLSLVLALSGANASLKEETATIWTTGFDFNPEALPEFSLGVTYFDIDYKDRIAVGGPPGDPMSVLFHEDEWAPIITRDPSPEQVAELCDSPLLVHDPSLCTDFFPAVIIDERLRNLASVHVKGVDVTMQYGAQLRSGRLEIGLNGSYMRNYDRAIVVTAPEDELEDTLGYPQRMRLRGWLSHDFRQVNITAAMNYSGGYTDTGSVPSRKIDSWTTIDLAITYRNADTKGWLRGTELALTAINAFDKQPPFVNVYGVGYDAANADMLGRIVGLRLVKGW